MLFVQAHQVKEVTALPTAFVYVDDYSRNDPSLHGGVLHSMITSLKKDYKNVTNYEEEGLSKANGGKMKRWIKITRALGEEELFDGALPHPNFWELLLTRGAEHVDTVSVYLPYGSCTHPLHHASSAVCYRWYPRSLLKTLLLVSD